MISPMTHFMKTAYNVYIFFQIDLSYMSVLVVLVRSIRKNHVKKKKNNAL